MSSIPDGMLTNGRPPIPYFDPDELLFRRIQPNALRSGRLTIASIELPDISTNRSSLGPPEWVLVSEKNEFDGWGIARLRVGDIPQQMLQHGAIEFTFGVEHKPLLKNYPHSEVRAYERGRHVDGKTVPLDPDLHLRFRVDLLLKTKIHQYPDARS